MHVTTQVFRVEGVVDTTGAGKGLKRLVVMVVIIVLFALLRRRTGWRSPSCPCP